MSLQRFTLTVLLYSFTAAALGHPVKDKGNITSQFNLNKDIKWELIYTENPICHFEDVIIEGKSVVLDFEKFDITDLSNISPHAFLRGSVRGYTNSHVFLALFDSLTLGYIFLDGAYYSIAQNRTGSTFIHKLENGLPAFSGCGTKEDSYTELLRSNPPKLSEDHVNLLDLESQRRRFDIYVEGDVSFRNSVCLGSSGLARNYAYTLVAAVSDIYVRDIGVALWVSAPPEIAETEKYSALEIDPLYDQFRNAHYMDFPGSAAVLLTGKRDNSIAGLTKGIEVLCDNKQSFAVCHMDGDLIIGNDVNEFAFPYGQWMSDINVFAHELGHLFGAYHTHNCWAYLGGPIDKCAGPEDGSCFYGNIQTLGTIMSYCNNKELKFHPLVSYRIQDAIFGMNGHVGSPIGCYAKLDKPTLEIPHRIQLQKGDTVGIRPIVSGTKPYSIRWKPTENWLDNDYLYKFVPKKTQTYFIQYMDDHFLRIYDSVRFEVSGSQSAVDLTTSANQINITPNPFSSKIDLAIQNHSTTNCMIRFLDILGHTLRTESIELNEGHSLLDFEVFHAGFYILQGECGDCIKFNSFLIKK